MTNSKNRSGWHNDIALERVMQFMCQHDMSAEVWEAMTEHDAIDYEMTFDWLRLRRLGHSWAAMVRADVEALESIDTGVGRV
jgi:hypothetical protein